MALLQFVPEGGEDPGEGMPDYDESGRVLLTEQPPQCGVRECRRHLLGLLIGLADKYQILSVSCVSLTGRTRGGGR